MEYRHKGSGRCQLRAVGASRVVPHKWKLLSADSSSRGKYRASGSLSPFLTSPLSIAKKISGGQRPVSSLVWKGCSLEQQRSLRQIRSLSLGNFYYELKGQSDKSNKKIAERL